MRKEDHFVTYIRDTSIRIRGRALRGWGLCEGEVSVIVDGVK